MTTSNDLTERLRAALDRDDAIALLRGAIGAESITGNEASFVGYLEDQMRARRIDNLHVSDFLPGRPNIRGERRAMAEASGCCSSAIPTLFTWMAGGSIGLAPSGMTHLVRPSSTGRSGAGCWRPEDRYL